MHMAAIAATIATMDGTSHDVPGTDTLAGGADAINGPDQLDGAGSAVPGGGALNTRVHLQQCFFFSRNIN